MKACTLLIFGGVILAAVISAYSFPAPDETTARPTFLTSHDGTSSAPVPPSVSPLATGSAAAPFSPSKPIVPGSFSSSSESDSKESDEKGLSTTAKTLFRRSADDPTKDDDSDDSDDDDGDDGPDDDAYDGDSRSKRQFSSSQHDVKGELSQGYKPEEPKKEDEEKKVPGLGIHRG